VITICGNASMIRAVGVLAGWINMNEMPLAH
jgi:hypothetical protein